MRLEIVAVLYLSCLLLNEFIRNQVTRNFAPDVNDQPVIAGEVALVGRGKIGGSSGVGKVLRHDRIEIVLRVRAGGRHGNRIVPARLLQPSVARQRVVAAAGCNQFAMQAGISLAARVELHYAAHLAAILRRKSSGVNAHRFEIVGFNLRAKAGRPIIRQRNSIDNELRLIL